MRHRMLALLISIRWLKRIHWSGSAYSGKTCQPHLTS